MLWFVALEKHLFMLVFKYLSKWGTKEMVGRYKNGDI